MNGDPEVLGAGDEEPPDGGAATPLTAAEEAALRRQLADGTYWVGPHRIERLLATLDTARDSRPVGEGLDVKRLATAMDHVSKAGGAQVEWGSGAHSIAAQIAAEYAALQAGPAAVRPKMEDERSFYRPGEIVGWAGPDRHANDAAAVRPTPSGPLAEALEAVVRHVGDTPELRRLLGQVVLRAAGR